MNIVKPALLFQASLQMKLISVALAIVAYGLLAASHVDATYRDENGTVKLTSEELDTMLSPSERSALVETMVRAYSLEQNRRRKQRRFSPEDTYAPVHVPCPPIPEGENFVGFVRNASDNKPNQQETEYLKRHREQNRDKWADWLKRAGLDGRGGLPGGVDQYLQGDGQQPRVGIAVSGGGYRAMLVGLGVAQGFDERNDTSKQRGVGGFLQLSDFFAGLSGGSWATGTLAMNDWRSSQDIVDNVMELSSNLVKPDHDALTFYQNLFKDGRDKKHAGFPVSISDYWGRALSLQLLDEDDKSPTYADHGKRGTYSDIRNTTNFKNATYPIPVVLSIGREPNEIMINPNATYFEYTPFEFGSWQPSLQAFFDTQYMGSDMMNGQQNAKDKSCIMNYDNFGYTVSTSSTLFNGAYNVLIESNSSGILTDIIKTILEDVGKGKNDVAPIPNPFKGYRADTNRFKGEDYIDLVDGGLANQNIPFEPLIQPARALDMIVGVDASSDQSGWPNGTVLYETQKRMQLKDFQDVAFPKVPGMNTMVNKGYNTRPTFFGCNPDDATNAKRASHPAPVVVYLPSYPYSHFTNASTFELAYNEEHQQGMIDNSLDVATMGGKMDNWHQCLACASVLRSLQRGNHSIPKKCQRCFDMYCWDGKEDNSNPGHFTPDIGLPPFVASQGKKNDMPPVTGTNKSDSSDIGSIIGSKDSKDRDGKDTDDKDSAATLDTSMFIVTALSLASMLTWLV